MKKILFVVIAMMTTVNINAQIEEGNWYVTPKLGFGISDMTGTLFDPTKAEGTYDATLRSIATFTAGVEFQYAIIDQLGLSAGLNYGRRGSKTEDDMFRVSMDYVNIPVTLDFYPIPNVGLAVKAGVQVGFTTRKRLKVNGVEYNADFDLVSFVDRWGRIRRGLWENELSRQFNKVDFSIPLAVSYEFMNVVLEARYSLGLVNVMKDDPENSKHRFWQFTLGYKFDLGD